jgi:hypothetical protein
LDNELDSAADAELSIEALEMVVNGVLRDPQFLRCCRFAHVVEYGMDDFKLPRRQVQ